jgi:hypothetical protein
MKKKIIHLVDADADVAGAALAYANGAAANRQRCDRVGLLGFRHPNRFYT